MSLSAPLSNGVTRSVLDSGTVMAAMLRNGDKEPKYSTCADQSDMGWVRVSRPLHDKDLAKPNDNSVRSCTRLPKLPRLVVQLLCMGHSCTPVSCRAAWGLPSRSEWLQSCLPRRLCSWTSARRSHPRSALQPEGACSPGKPLVVARHGRPRHACRQEAGHLVISLVSDAPGQGHHLLRLLPQQPPCLWHHHFPPFRPSLPLQDAGRAPRD
jgi:hypothetical protein